MADQACSWDDHRPHPCWAVHSASPALPANTAPGHVHRYESRGRADVQAWDCACGDTLAAAFARHRADAADRTRP